MGQFEVYKIFRNRPCKWLGAEDLKTILDGTRSTRGNITTTLNKLRKFKMLYRKIVKETKGGISYNKHLYKLVPQDKKPILYDFQDDKIVTKQNPINAQNL